MSAKIKSLTAAFPNSDTDGMFQEILRKHPGEIVDAFQKLGDSRGLVPDEMIVPTEELGRILTPLAQPAGIRVTVSDFVKVRDYPETEFVSFVTLYNQYEKAQGRTPTLFVSIDYGPLQELHPGDPLSSILPEPAAKAYLINHRFYEKQELEEPLTEAWNTGSGLIITISAADCLVQAVGKETRTLRERSCGICTFCREGLCQLDTTLAGMEKPGTAPTQLDLMEEIGEAMRISGMCSVGHVSADPVLSALRVGKEELAAHCGRGKCPAEQCSGFQNIYIDPHKCEGNGDCMDVCPVDCIDGKPRFISMIDEFECTKCGKCISACENEAIILTSRRVPKLPTRPTRVGRFR